MSLTWLFLRHGESTANAARRLSGWEDVVLTDHGRQQARDAGEELANWTIERVLSSDLVRAYDTARLGLSVWASKRGDPTPEIRTHRELRERNLGTFQGKHLDTLRKNGNIERLLGWDSRPPHGESHADIAARAVPFLARLPPTIGPTLLVGHGGLIRTLLGLVDEVSLSEIGKNRIPNGQVIDRQLSPNRWKEIALNLGYTPCD